MNSATSEILHRLDAQTVASLVELHLRAFPAHMQCDDPRAYFSEALEIGDNINIVTRDPGGTLTGYLLGIPQNLVAAELRREDPEFCADPERIYLDIIQVSPERRGQGHAYALFRGVCAEAGRRGFDRLSMHARTTTGLNRYLQRIFADIRCLRRIENWYGCGEPFDYLETTTAMQ